MTITDGILQGIIQGLTEFLPISSDGHLAIYQHFTANYGENALVFTLVLHLGTLAAVLFTYRSTVAQLIGEGFALLGDGLSGRLFKTKPTADRSFIYMLIVATLPLFGFVPVKDFITSFSQDDDIIMEGLCFIFTAMLLFLSAKCVKGDKRAENMTVRDGLIIGFFQALAILPGVSRSGSTIAAGLLLGYDRDFMVKFSFILSIPAILGACVLDIPEIMAAGLAYSPAVMAAGLASSAIVGLLAIRVLRYLVVGDKFIIFSYYTFGLGVAVLLAALAEKLSGYAMIF